MLTPEQQKWIDHLSDTEIVRIFPFDPTSPEKFEHVREQIQTILGDEFPAEHHGATCFGISGQSEIDVYVPVPANRFDETVSKLSEVLGSPRSHYPMNRARFAIEEKGKHVDIFPVNRDGIHWKVTLAFEHHLRTHSEDLNRYRELKESGDGLSVREYYRRKYDFVNIIVPPGSRE